MVSPNDPELVRQQYATDANLRIRQSIHDTYTVPKANFAEWVIAALLWQGNERVLDVGCGAGNYCEVLLQQCPDIDYYGLDLSAGMLVNHPAAVRSSVGDAQQLPFPDGQFDVVMANHMLFYVQDIDAAIVEFRRVLKPHGILLAATNSAYNMAELQVLLRRAILLLVRPGMSQVYPPTPASAYFGLENGARRLARHFFAVARYDLPSKLVFTEIDPILAYLESTRPVQEPQLPEGVAWDDVMTIMGQQIMHLINHLGELVINKLAGVLVASDDGGFIQEFVRACDNSAETSY